jgi:hypothetical protein
MPERQNVTSRIASAFLTAVDRMGRLLGRAVSAIVEPILDFARRVSEPYGRRPSIGPDPLPYRDLANDRPVMGVMREPSFLDRLRGIWDPRNPASLVTKIVATVVAMAVGAVVLTARVLSSFINGLVAGVRGNRTSGRSDPLDYPVLQERGPEMGPTGPSATRASPAAKAGRLERLREMIENALLSDNDALTSVAFLQSLERKGLFGPNYSRKEIVEALRSTPFAHLALLYDKSANNRVPPDHPLVLRTSDGRAVEVHGRLDDPKTVDALLRQYGHDKNFQFELSLALYSRLDVAQARSIIRENNLSNPEMFLKTQIGDRVKMKSDILEVATYQNGRKVEHALPYNEESKQWIRNSLKDLSEFHRDYIVYLWDRHMEKNAEAKAFMKAEMDRMRSAPSRPSGPLPPGPEDPNPTLYNFNLKEIQKAASARSTPSSGTNSPTAPREYDTIPIPQQAANPAAPNDEEEYRRGARKDRDGFGI